MKTTVNLYTFRRAFETLRPDNFSYEGLELLFDWFEEYEECADEEIELDVIAICCDFQESTFDEVIQDYCIKLEEGETLEEYLSENTSFVGKTSDNNYIFSSF